MEKLGPGDPQRIGAYRLLARLGAGGMGQVYLARSDRGRTVAVKLVRQELAEQEEFRARFRHEVAAARRIGGRWTAAVLDADTEAVVPWVATGYVAGPDLQAVVSGEAAGHGPLPERSVHILGAGLAHALRDIHAAGLIHRDLKPSNILVTIDGPRVIDFGIARALETTTTTAALTRAGALVGSPGFMAPEQVRGEPITPSCDIFCLGSVLAYAATGRLPFGTADSGVHALMYRIATEPPALDQVPEGLQDLIRACLHKDPAARPTLAHILERTRGGGDGEPWLPAALVAHLGRHATQLLDVENPADAITPPGAAAPGPPGAPGPADHGGDPGAPAPHAIPTLVAPSAPAPPSPYARAQPQPHRTPPHPAPPPHRTPPHTPPGGYGYPAPQYPYQPPAPEPPPRSGRATAALIAVALVVALGAGGSVYAFMNAGDGKQHTTHSDTPTDGSTASARGQKTPAPAPSADTSPSPSPSAARDGSVPAGYLGTWVSGLDNGAGHNTRRLVIRQGEVGDPVLTLTADGPAEGGGTYHCVFEAELAAAPSDGQPLRIGPSRITAGEPMSSCTPGAATEVTLLSDGRLRRVNTAGGESLTYTKPD
ncbi:serine/threonine-protein kinase [Streptomyces sp. Wb2n-11]|uniref:serine/threonine-protein kinase n=1 Tax=Streptomyces sp. Wb2n-11 TaxID=1030533 RepID=UPI000AACD134|nr:serine/threonine-protein kinase [Streptomyces sp. Wb2n-11]